MVSMVPERPGRGGTTLPYHAVSVPVWHSLLFFRSKATFSHQPTSLHNRKQENLYCRSRIDEAKRAISREMNGMQEPTQLKSARNHRETVSREDFKSGTFVESILGSGIKRLAEK